MGAALDLAIGSLDPADGGSEVDRHHDMLLVVHEHDGVADVLLEADLMVFGIVVERGLVLADDGLVLIVIASQFAADEGELEVAALGEVDEADHQYWPGYPPHKVIL